MRINHIESLSPSQGWERAQETLTYSPHAGEGVFQYWMPAEGITTGGRENWVERRVGLIDSHISDTKILGYGWRLFFVGIANPLNPRRNASHCFWSLLRKLPNQTVGLVVPQTPRNNVNF